jgi:hypothetical protein
MPDEFWEADCEIWKEALSNKPELNEAVVGVDLSFYGIAIGF